MRSWQLERERQLCCFAVLCIALSDPGPALLRLVGCLSLNRCLCNLWDLSLTHRLHVGREREKNMLLPCPLTFTFVPWHVSPHVLSHADCGVVVGRRMAPKHSYIWILSTHLAEPLERIRRPCWRRCVTEGGLWSLKGLSFLVRFYLYLQLVDQDVRFLLFLSPCLCSVITDSNYPSGTESWKLNICFYMFPGHVVSLQ